MSLPRRRTYLPADARREQLLEAAKRVFARRGYPAVNIADICKEAKVARGTIYQYFRNKRDVLMELLDEIAARVEVVLANRPSVEVPRDVKMHAALITQFCRHRLREVLDAVFATSRRYASSCVTRAGSTAWSTAPSRASTT